MGMGSEGVFVGVWQGVYVGGRWWMMVVEGWGEGCLGGLVGCMGISLLV